MNIIDELLGWTCLSLGIGGIMWLIWFIGDMKLERERYLTNWLIDEFETVLQENKVPYEIKRWVRRDS